MINPFSTNVPLLNSSKPLFRGYRSGTLVENGLNRTIRLSRPNTEADTWGNKKLVMALN